MSTNVIRGLLLAAASLLLSSAAFGQAEIQLHARRQAGWDARQREGHCQIRVWVDNRAQIRLRGDRIWLTTLRGAEARDQGSECSQSLPFNSVRGFQIRQSAGRSPVRLMQEPSRANNYTAMIAIEDQQSGGGAYAFDVTWRADGDAANAPAPFFDDVRACQDLVRQRFASQNVRGAYIDFDNFADRQAMGQDRRYDNRDQIQRQGPGPNQGQDQGQVQDQGQGQYQGRIQDQGQGQVQDQGQGQNQRQAQDQGRRRRPDRERIQGRGSAKSWSETRDLTYDCVVDTQRNQVESVAYQYVGDGVRLNGRNPLR